MTLGTAVGVGEEVGVGVAVGAGAGVGLDVRPLYRNAIKVRGLKKAEREVNFFWVKCGV